MSGLLIFFVQFNRPKIPLKRITPYAEKLLKFFFQQFFIHTEMHKRSDIGIWNKLNSTFRAIKLDPYMSKALCSFRLYSQSSSDGLNHIRFEILCI